MFNGKSALNNGNVSNFIENISDPIVYKVINVASDFPTIAEADANVGRVFYVIGTNVTDNDPAKTNTGQSFTQGQTIFWNETPNTWTINDATSSVVSVAGKTGVVTLDKNDVGLGNVDNTSDVNKPISTATQNALNLKADLASPAFTGNPTAPTQSAGDNSTKIATTAYVEDATSNANVIASVLTGFSAAVSRTAILATDTILQAFEKSQKYFNDLATLAFSGSASDITSGTLDVARLPTAIDAANIANGSVSNAEFQYLDGVTSAIQTQINGKEASLGFTPENVANKSTNTSLGTSDTLYPTQNAVKSYVDAAATVPDASTSVKGIIQIADQTAQETASSTTLAVTSGRQQFHPSAAKAWVNFNGTGTVAIRSSYNVTSIVDNSTGNYTVNFTTNMSNTNYFVGVMHSRDLGSPVLGTNTVYSMAVGSVRVVSANTSGVVADAEGMGVVIYGDL